MNGNGFSGRLNSILIDRGLRLERTESGFNLYRASVLVATIERRGVRLTANGQPYATLLDAVTALTR